MKKRYKLNIAYDGTLYSGWQIQPKSVSVQELIEKALYILTKEKLKVFGASRTDAGVHALDQVAHFSFEEMDLVKLQNSLNGILPKDIRIKNITEVSETFHARYSTKGKIYHYFLSNASFQDPFDSKYSFHFPHKLDLALLKEAASFFIGKHDFTSFANNHLSGAALTKPIKTITKLNIDFIDDKIRFEFEADGFLYKMIRNIVGTLLEVAVHKRHLKSIQDIFLAKDRKKAGPAVPAKGLFLVKVHY